MATAIVNSWTTTESMNDQRTLTAEQFATELPELPEAGRWHELDRGRVVMLQPPDLDHGNVVLNLSKAFGEWAGKASDVGYACFELGLWVSRNPDTVISPAMSYFVAGERFAETDKRMTDVRPSLIMELASTNDRRRAMRERVMAYHEWGVDEVWVVDPIEKSVRLLPRGQASRSLSERHVLADRSVLPDFSVSVKQLFAEPEWWSG